MAESSRASGSGSSRHSTGTPYPQEGEGFEVNREGLADSSRASRSRSTGTPRRRAENGYQMPTSLNRETLAEASRASSHSSHPRMEDEGDSKPPSRLPPSARPSLQLHTPQIDEESLESPMAATDGGAGSGGVAALPNRSPSRKHAEWTAAGVAAGSDDEWTDDGLPYRPPPVQPRSVRPSTTNSVSPSVATYPPPLPLRTSTSSPATYGVGSARSPPPPYRPPAGAASAVPAPQDHTTTTSDEKAARDKTGDDGEARTGGPCARIPPKYLYLIAAVVVALLVAVIVVVVIVVGNNNNDSAPSPSPGGAAPGPAPTGGGGSDPNNPGVSTLAAIKERGTLTCGIGFRQGFSLLEDGEWTGFEVDLCRAVAAGLFGVNAPVNFLQVSIPEQFPALQSGEVDMIARVLTHTMERDVYEPGTGAGYSFSTPYLYAGLGFGGEPVFASCADQLNTTVGSCPDLKICVLDGTTHVARVEELIPDASTILSPSIEAFYSTFKDGLCNVLAGEQYDIAEAVLRANGYTGFYYVGENLYSKEPLALVTRDGDPEWSDFVNWIVQGLLAAEEQEITQSDANSFTKSTVFGEEYENMFVNALTTVGNYAEMYERHLEPIIPRSLANNINQGDSGLIYAFPMGSVSTDGPDPVEGGTLETIKQRGHLKCGITRRAVFAVFDTDSQEWEGLDIDFCKAVSAAIFNGVTNTIVYTVLPATDRFQALQSGSVDILSRITTLTLERDVMEPNTGVGFSFSQPNFYDGLSFGGIPPYGECADNLDVTSKECEDLLICVNDGTTFLTRLKELLPERFIAPQQTGELAIQGLANEDCNAIAGGVQDVSEASVRDVGEYEGEYEQGVNRFSKDPLAVVTRQDDPQFSAFVYWIVSATFFAEEEGITQDTASRMPVVNLFGPLYSRMLRDVIEAVGGYGEIYDRNAEEQIPRGGLNVLNVNPLGPQHYPFPGL